MGLTSGFCRMSMGGRGAASCGRLEILQWARAKWCSCEWRICALATERRGHVEVLARIRENGAKTFL